MLPSWSELDCKTLAPNLIREEHNGAGICCPSAFAYLRPSSCLPVCTERLACWACPPGTVQPDFARLYVGAQSFDIAPMLVGDTSYRVHGAFQTGGCILKRELALVAGKLVVMRI